MMACKWHSPPEFAIPPHVRAAGTVAMTCSSGRQHQHVVNSIHGFVHCPAAQHSTGQQLHTWSSRRVCQASRTPESQHTDKSQRRTSGDRGHPKGQSRRSPLGQQQQPTHTWYNSDAQLITGSIKGCHNWMELSAVWQQWEPVMNQVHLTALLMTAVKVPASSQGSASPDELAALSRWMPRVLEAVLPRLQHCRPRELSSIAWAASKLGALPNSSSARPASRRQTVKKAASDKQREVAIASAAAHSLDSATAGLASAETASVMQYSGFVERQSGWLSDGQVSVQAPVGWWPAVLDQCSQRLPQFNGHDMSMLLVAVVAVQFDSEAQHQQQHQHQVGTRPMALPSTRTTGSRGKQGEEPGGQYPPINRSLRGVLPAGLLPGIIQATQQQLAEYGPQALSNTIWALAKLRIVPPGEWLDAFLDASSRQLGKSEPQAIANTAWALAVMEVTPSPSWRTAFLSSSASSAGQAAPASLSQMLWAAARLPGPAPPVQWAGALCAATAGRLHTFNPQDLANMLWAVGALGYAPPSRWLEAVIQTVASQVATFQALEIAAVLSALARLKYQPPSTILRTLCAHMLQRRQPAAGVQEVCNALWAVAVLKYSPDAAWLQAALKRVAQQLDDLGPSELAQLWWALSALGIQPSAALASALQDELLVQMDVMQSQEVAMVLYGYAQLDMHVPKALLDRLMTQLLLGLSELQQEQGQGVHQARVGYTAATAITALAKMATRTRGLHGLNQGTNVLSLLRRSATGSPHIRRWKTGQELWAPQQQHRSKAAKAAQSPVLPGWEAMDVALVLEGMSYLQQALPRVWSASALQGINSRPAGQWGAGSQAAAIAMCAVTRLHGQHVAASTLSAARMRAVGIRLPAPKPILKMMMRRHDDWQQRVHKQWAVKRPAAEPSGFWLSGWGFALAPHLAAYTASDWQRLSFKQVAGTSYALMYMSAMMFRRLKRAAGQASSSSSSSSMDHTSTWEWRCIHLLLLAERACTQHALGLAAQGLLDSVQTSLLLQAQTHVQSLRRALHHGLPMAVEGPDDYALQISKQLLASPCATGAALSAFGPRELCALLSAAARLGIQQDPEWLTQVCRTLELQLHPCLEYRHDPLFSAAAAARGGVEGGSEAWQQMALDKAETQLQTADQVLAVRLPSKRGRRLRKVPSALSSHDCATGIAALKWMLQKSRRAHRGSEPVWSHQQQAQVLAVIQMLGVVQVMLIRAGRRSRSRKEVQFLSGPGSDMYES